MPVTFERRSKFGIRHSLPAGACRQAGIFLGIECRMTNDEVATRNDQRLALKDINTLRHKCRIIDISLFICSEKCARIKLSI